MDWGTDTPTLPAPPRTSERPTVPWTPSGSLLRGAASGSPKGNTSPAEPASATGLRESGPFALPALRPWLGVMKQMALGSLVAGLAASLLWWADTVPSPRLRPPAPVAHAPVAVAAIDTGRALGAAAAMRATRRSSVDVILLDPFVVTRGQGEEGAATPSPSKKEGTGTVAEHAPSGRARRHNAARPPTRRTRQRPNDAKKSPAAAAAPSREERVEEEIEHELLALHEMLPDLGAEQVRALVARHRPRLQQCYSVAMRRAGRGRDLSLRLTVDVAPTGKVAGASVEGSDLAGLGRCLMGVARTWHFPPSRSGARIPIPLSFTATP